MRHLTEKEIDRLVIDEPEITIGGYIRFCKELEEELKAIRRTQMPAEISTRVENGKYCYATGASRSIWTAK